MCHVSCARHAERVKRVEASVVEALQIDKSQIFRLTMFAQDDDPFLCGSAPAKSQLGCAIGLLSHAENLDST